MYLPRTRAKLTRQGGGDALKGPDDLGKLRADGYQLEYWQAMMNPGQAPKAADVIRHVWRTRVLDNPTQQVMLTRFGSLLSSEDIAARATTDPDAKNRAWAARGGIRDQVVDAIKAGDWMG